MILVPLGYAYDEPLDALAEATHRALEVTWVFTGDAPERFKRNCSGKSTLFPGFVSRADYHQLLQSSDVVLAPTNMERTMQRVGYESMIFEKALVTTSTRVLRQFFNGAAVFVEPTTNDIVRGVRAAVDSRNELVRRMVDLKTERIRDQRIALGQLIDWLETCGGDGAANRSPDSCNSRKSLTGLPLDALTLDQSVVRCHELIAMRSQHHTDLNASILLEAQRNARLRTCLKNSALVNADGQSIVWAAAALGVPVPERVSGIDLFIRLLKEAPGRGYRVYFLGATQEVVSRVADRFIACGVEVVGWRSGYWQPEEEHDVVEEIAHSQPDLLFVGMPSPFKEEFVSRHLDSLNVGLAFGVGGAFDVVAGRTARAPYWMQRIGLEWFYRFIQEPRRLFKRYFVGNIRFVVLVARSLILVNLRRVRSKLGIR